MEQEVRLELSGPVVMEVEQSLEDLAMSWSHAQLVRMEKSCCFVGSSYYKGSRAPPEWMRLAYL